MQDFKLSFCRIFSVFCVLLPVFSYANLLITPTRVVFDERSRSEEIHLINSGETTKSYRLEWVELKALPAGGYRELTEEEKASFPSLSRMTRLSPKQVRLEPQGRQVVKVGLRRPRNLPNGEYRSHLRFTALPDEQEQAPDEGFSINIKMLLSYTIPVVMRQGSKNVQVAIEGLGLSYDPQAQQANVKVQLGRTGISSPNGSIYAYWTPQGSTSEKRVGILNEYNIYTELPKAEVNMPWQGFSMSDIGSGTLRVVFEGKKEYAGVTFAESRFNIAANNFVAVPSQPKN